MNKGKEKRIAALKETQEHRKQECLEKTEKAIIKLSQTNQKLSFANIAREANVSISYLYKYPEIKDRIQHLRNQQEQGAKPVQPQLRSDKSSQVIIGQLRDRIKSLEGEKKELTRQNEALTGRLYVMGNTQDLLDRLKAENCRLNDENKQLRAELESTQRDLNDCQQRLIDSNPKIASLEQKRNQPTTDEINEELEAQFFEVGIRLNQTLRELIKSVPEEQAINALSVVKEALAVGKVRSKAGLFRKALEECWTPNESDEERKINEIQENFSEWFKLAKAQGIVQASQGTKDGIIVLDSTGEWILLKTMFEKGWTLEYLEQRQNQS
jgi:transcriptional regulator with XRE-family HTH domain